MCGIAGFSFSPTSSINARQVARALFSDIQSRGREASGYAAFAPDGTIDYGKSDECADKFCTSRAFRLAAEARCVILHTRLATKGTVKNPLNNHPVLSYAEQGEQVAVVHNGGVWNDDEIFRTEEMLRYGQVDSEAIPAMIAKYGSALYGPIFASLEGGIATGWLDERTPNTLHLTRAWDSPMFVAHLNDVTDSLGLQLTGVLFASTIRALTKALEALGVEWDADGVSQYEIGEGEYLSITDGEWDGMVYPMVLPDQMTRWERKRRNAATQGYTGTTYYGGMYGWDEWDEANTPTTIGRPSGAGATGTGIGSGNVPTGKPSVEQAAIEATKVLVSNPADDPNGEGTLATVTSIHSMTDAEWLEAQEHGTVIEGMTGTGWPSDEDVEGKEGFYASAFDYLARDAQIKDYLARRGDYGDAFTPTAADILLLASLTADEMRFYGFDLRQVVAWQDDHLIHMDACGPDACAYDHIGCPAVLLAREPEGEGVPVPEDRMVTAAASRVIGEAAKAALDADDAEAHREGMAAALAAASR